MRVTKVLHMARFLFDFSLLGVFLQSSVFDDGYLSLFAIVEHI